MKGNPLNNTNLYLVHTAKPVHEHAKELALEKRANYKRRSRQQSEPDVDFDLNSLTANFSLPREHFRTQK
jgi:hypothetical protein